MSRIAYTSSTRRRFDLATKLGGGAWISQGSYPDLAAAETRANTWLDAAGDSGQWRISDEIGQVVKRKRGTDAS